MCGRFDTSHLTRADIHAQLSQFIRSFPVTPDAGEVASFTILTGPSEGWLGDDHTRAPVILEPEAWGT